MPKAENINSTSPQYEVSISQHGRAKSIVLDRPKALNALNPNMIAGLQAHLEEAADDDATALIMLSGAGERAFCAGGDVKQVALLGADEKKGIYGTIKAADFFAHEYILNQYMHHYKKPTIAFMNGIVMGGGYGVAAPCTYRICSEKTLFAMPEVAIVLFPDVGSVYYLNQAPGEIGAFMAVTGNRFNAADLLYAGVATHYIALDAQEDCREKLANATTQAEIKAILDQFASVPDMKSDLSENRKAIDRCFAFDSIQEILAALKHEGSQWAQEILDIIMTRSPTSLHVTLRHYRQASGQTLDHVIERDFALAQHFLAEHDFFEGIRTVLIDKDNNPQWSPANFEDVSEGGVNDYFTPAALKLEDYRT